MDLPHVHSETTLSEWDKILRYISLPEGGSADNVVLDGHNLDVASIVAVARHLVPVKEDSEKLKQLNKGSAALRKGILEGQVIYGVNTGFGGSADSRTRKLEQLQDTLIRDLRYGVLPQNTKTISSKKVSKSAVVSKLSTSLMNEDANCSVMPEAWSRGTILIRANSLIRGHSAIRSQVVERIVDLLRYNIVPQIPMYGSISASGDLSPLSYVGAAIQGRSNAAIWPKHHKGSDELIVSSAQALKANSLQPIRLAAKESLAIVNGTAATCASAALAMHDANGLAVLSQILTAMSVEALNGTSESFDSFFSQVRPHPGQIEIAHNIFNFLKGSQLIANNKYSEAGTLCQDRYSLRTVPQWIGPVLEDLMLANQQVTIEANSTTDNPLVDPNGRVLSGGNFQAKALTSAMEKVRQGVQTMGRMHFVQCTEIINPTTNRGLSPNLVLDEVSEAFHFKGIDISIAAFASELGFLANPVGSHVQSAEMGNQALNSLALISARYTHTALDILSRLVASHLLAACQALDLRAMHLKFLDNIRPQIDMLNTELLLPCLEQHKCSKIFHSIWTSLQKTLLATSGQDSKDRFQTVSRLTIPIILDQISEEHTDIRLLSIIQTWKRRLSTTLEESWISTRTAYLKHGDAKPYLGQASRRMYSFVRDELNVPFISSAILKGRKPGSSETQSQPQRPQLNGTISPSIKSSKSGKNDLARIDRAIDGESSYTYTDIGTQSLDSEQESIASNDEYDHFDEEQEGGESGLEDWEQEGEDVPTIGSFVGTLYTAIRNGTLLIPAMECLREANRDSGL